MIGGNITAVVQVKTITKNDIGEAVATWADVQQLKGFLDLQHGDSPYLNFNTKLQESTHIFICDYTPLNAAITPENSRLRISGKLYDALLYDNPMELNKHLEIYLKYTGG